MEKYFIIVNGQQQGPFTKKEIINKKLHADTSIYSKSLGDWKKISEIPIFLEEFGSNLPPTLKLTPPKTYLTESILVTLFCCLPFGVVGIINASKVESAYMAGNYQIAQTASLNAKKWYKRALWSGIIFLMLYLAFIIVTTYIFINPNLYNY